PTASAFYPAVPRFPYFSASTCKNRLGEFLRYRSWPRLFVSSRPIRCLSSTWPAITLVDEPRRQLQANLNVQRKCFNFLTIWKTCQMASWPQKKDLTTYQLLL